MSMNNTTQNYNLPKGSELTSFPAFIKLKCILHIYMYAIKLEYINYICITCTTLFTEQNIVFYLTRINIK